MTENNPKGFWQSLERIPGLAAVQAEWRIYMGDEFESAKGFLRPNGKLASSHPCTIQRGCGCYHDVVIHGDDDIVAVCRCGRECGLFPLQRSDIAVYELNRLSLFNAIANAFNLVIETESYKNHPNTMLIGAYSPFAGFRFPVYLTMQLEADDFVSAVNSLLGRINKPFILMSPTRDLYSSQTEILLSNRKSAFVPLLENVNITENRNIRLLRPFEEIMLQFRTLNLPSSSVDGALAFFPTPADATWRDVSIKFKDGYTVSIKVKTISGVFNYTQMGMANKKNSNPTVQWDLLYTFANEHGTLDWTSSQAHRRNKKRREILAANLRTFFRIEGDPFRLTKDGKGWQSCFQLHSE